MPLAPGIITKGQISLLNILHHFGIPENLKGKRFLDIGCSDGFLSSLAEQRGVSVVEVNIVPIKNLNLPAGKSSFFRGILSPEASYPARERIASVIREYVIEETAVLNESGLQGISVCKVI